MDFEIRDKEYRRIFDLQSFLEQHMQDESAAYIADKVESEPSIYDVENPKMEELLDVLESAYPNNNSRDRIIEFVKNIQYLVSKMKYRSNGFAELKCRLNDLEDFVKLIEFAY